jgi:hypothetical protein
MRERAQQHIAPANVVFDAEQLRGPLVERRAGESQFADRRQALAVDPWDRHAIDQQSRSLVAESRAGGPVHADQAVLGELAGLDPEVLAEIFQQGFAALHPVGDVVGEQHPVGAHRLGVQEAVETRHPAHGGEGQAEAFGDLGQRLRRQPAAAFLHLAQHLHQVQGIHAPAPEHGRHVAFGPRDGTARVGVSAHQ